MALAFAPAMHPGPAPGVAEPHARAARLRGDNELLYAENERLLSENKRLLSEHERLVAEIGRLRAENRDLRAALDAHVARARSTRLYGQLELTAGTCVGPRRRTR